MASKNEIYMNFRSARAQADELERIGRQMQRLARNDMQGTLRDVHANWTGEHADEFLRKGEKIEDNINTTANQLIRTAATIRTIASNVYHAEMRAWEIAHSRKSGST